MVTEYEQKRVYNVNRYSLTGSLVQGHAFCYLKRRHIQTESKYSGFRPFCSCGWKSKTWYLTKALAEQEHTSHAKSFLVERPRLEGL